MYCCKGRGVVIFLILGGPNVPKSFRLFLSKILGGPNPIFTIVWTKYLGWPGPPRPIVRLHHWRVSSFYKMEVDMPFANGTSFEFFLKKVWKIKSEENVVFSSPFIFASPNNFGRMPNKFEFGATFSIVVFALNWFWFVFSFSLICTLIGGAESPNGKQHHLLINSQNNFKVERWD